MKVAIIGNGVIGNLAALYFRRKLPGDVDICVVGPESRGGLPVVGESTIEITARFMEGQLGLGEYLRKTHYPKYALTYYFKLDPSNPQDRRYSVQCNERAPQDLEPLPGWEGSMARPPAWQLNRSVFDNDMKEMVNENSGINRILGTVTNINMAQHDTSGSGHELEIKQDDGAKRTLEANWVIDATGRKQFLPKLLDLVVKPKPQRNCFWFRLSNFQRDLLKEVDALGPMPPTEGESYHYDRYYSTHHFMGHGNWIWMIPMRTADDSELISIGITSRPDVYPHTVRNIDDFLEHVAKVHPVVTDFVKSGIVEDTNVLLNYRYVVKQSYSADRWGIVGDASFAPDPLFSNGLAFCTVQLEQLGAMIARDHSGDHSAEYIEELQKVFWTPVAGSQNTIAEWYQSMEDPLLSAARLNLIEVSYFYMLLPLIVNRCHYEPDRLAEWSFMQASAGKPLDLPAKLLNLREKISKVEPSQFVYQGKEKVSLKALEVYDDLKDMRSQMKVGSGLLQRYVDELAEAWTGTIGS